MTRRSLFRSFCAAMAFSAMEVCGMREVKAVELIVNPAYAEAEYEQILWFHPAVIERMTEAKHVNKPHHNPRYNLKNGEWVEVPYYKRSDSTEG